MFKPISKIESRLNYLVGLTLMTNLYYISGLFFLPSILPILGVLMVSAYYFFKRVEPKQLLFQMNTWVILGFVLFSCFLYIPEFVMRQSAFNPNDMLRVLIYLFFIGWTVSIRSTWELMSRFLGMSALLALVVLTILGFIEKFFPVFFQFVLPPNLVRGSLTRIGTTLIDPNIYSTAMVVYFSAVLKYYSFQSSKSKFAFALLAIIPVFMLIETSGSRQGLLLFCIWLLSLALNLNWKATIVSLSIGAILLFAAFKIFETPLQNYAVENPNTSVSRILFPSDNKMSSNSNLERKESLESGLEFIETNFFIFGPGAFGYASAYANTLKREVAFPHNGPLFLWTQYGILTLYFFYLVWLIARRAYKAGLFVFFLFYLTQFLLMPNSSYYYLPVYLVLSIDAQFYHQVFGKQTQALNTNS